MSWKLFLLLFCAFYHHSEGRLTRTTRRPFIPTKNKYFELSILHINDFHNRFFETSPSSAVCLKEDECLGGMARLLTASRKLAKERPNAVFLDVSEHFSGTFWHNMSQWNASVHFLNKLPLDAMTLGNHDFNDHVTKIVSFLGQVKVPVVITNIDDSQELTLQGHFQNSTIIQRGTQKIGIIGVTAQANNSISKLKFLDEVKSINEEAAKLKNGSNIIIVLSQSSLDVNKMIAANTPYVDVIIYGQTHNYFDSASSNKKPEESHPMVVKQRKTGRSVLIAQATSLNKYLGNLTVWFDRRGEVVKYEENPILLDNSFEQDSEVAAELMSWKDEVEKFNSFKVGETKTFLNNSCNSEDCNLANLITDAMIHSYRYESNDSNITRMYAGISCINSDGMRSSVPVGNITYDKLISVMPFASTWDLIDLKGEDLYNALEEAVSRSDEKNRFTSSSFLHCAGVNVTYNLTKPEFSRIVSVQVSCQDCSESKFEDLQKEKSYRVIVPSYLLTNNDFKTIANKHTNRRVGKLDVELMIDYFNKISPIDYKPETRIVMTGEWSG